MQARILSNYISCDQQEKREHVVDLILTGGKNHVQGFITL
jgi:hypothetical protein